MFSYKIIKKPTKKNDHVRTYINCKKKIEIKNDENWNMEIRKNFKKYHLSEKIKLDYIILHYLYSIPSLYSKLIIFYYTKKISKKTLKWILK